MADVIIGEMLYKKIQNTKYNKYIVYIYIYIIQKNAIQKFKLLIRSLDKFNVSLISNHQTKQSTNIYIYIYTLENGPLFHSFWITRINTDSQTEPHHSNKAILIRDS